MTITEQEALEIAKEVKPVYGEHGLCTFTPSELAAAMTLILQRKLGEPKGWLWTNPDSSKEVTFVEPAIDPDPSTVFALELGRKAEPLYTAPQTEPKDTEAGAVKSN